MSKQFGPYDVIGFFLGLIFLIILTLLGIAGVVFACRAGWWMISGAWGYWS